MSILHEVRLNSGRKEFQCLKEMINMELPIEKSKYIYKTVNLLKAIFTDLRENDYSGDNMIFTKRTRKSMVMQAPENPAAYCQLGWRRDA